MIEKWRKILDNGGHFGALLTDLSKAFDCLIHDLLVAKLAAYGLSEVSLKLIQTYLTNRKQRTKISGKYSDWEEIIFGVPQGSVLKLLLFNISICDLFLTVNEIELASFADDNTPYVCERTTDLVRTKLQIKYNKSIFLILYSNCDF
jgi:hypothetical protein